MAMGIVCRNEKKKQRINNYYLINIFKILDLENTYDDEEEDEEAEEEVEDDEHNFSMDTSSDNISQMRVNNSIMSNVNDEGQFIEYDDEINSYQEDEEDGNIDAYADPISDNRPATKYPMINVNTKNYLDAQPTTPMPFGSSKFIRILFSKPAILVGKKEFMLLNFNCCFFSY